MDNLYLPLSVPWLASVVSYPSQFQINQNQRWFSVIEDWIENTISIINTMWQELSFFKGPHCKYAMVGYTKSTPMNLNHLFLIILTWWISIHLTFYLHFMPQSLKYYFHCAHTLSMITCGHQGLHRLIYALLRETNFSY